MSECTDSVYLVTVYNYNDDEKVPSDWSLHLQPSWVCKTKKEEKEAEITSWA